MKGSEFPFAREASKASIDLYWLPLGAGGWFIQAVNAGLIIGLVWLDWPSKMMVGA